MARIYLASSWRNPEFPEWVTFLRGAGHEVYDFQEPVEGSDGFRWEDIDPCWKSWSPKQYMEALDHPLAEAGFARDYEALQTCDFLVLLSPCGRSAHLEAGYAVGAGKPTLCVLKEGDRPELMIKMMDAVAHDKNQARRILDQWVWKHKTKTKKRTAPCN